MIVETSTDVFRRQISKCLLAYLFEDGVDEDIALQIVEIIALRMPRREDADVASVGVFVRTNLVWLDQGMMSYCELLERFTKAAAHAGLGYTALQPTLKLTIGDLSRP
jgi:hypothetical protein